MEGPRNIFGLLWLFLLLLPTLSLAQTTPPFVSFQWDSLPAIPPAPGQTLQPGLAGAFIGVHQNALIIAGGANFPHGPAWEGGEKVWYDDIYVLEKQGDQFRWVENLDAHLPDSIAYGTTVSTPEGLFCIGGNRGAITSAAVDRYRWDPQQRKLEREWFPVIPTPLANLNGGLIGRHLYVAGSEESTGQKYFWRLALDFPDQGWESLPVWPGSPRTHAYGVVQHNGVEPCFYLLMGRFPDENEKLKTFSDGYYYQPSQNAWKAIQTDLQYPELALSAGTALPLGANHILVLGGDEGKLFEAPDSTKRNHPGFSRQVWAFHTITESWARLEDLPQSSQVTTTALWWNEQLIIPTGEIAPCIRTPQIRRARVRTVPQFGKLNTGIVVVYFLLLAGMGVYFARKQTTLEDYFKGGQRIPWWAAGLSIFGTQLSAITFMAVPAKTFATDWVYLFLSLTIVMASPFIVWLFLPHFRRYELTTAYEYLERRFNLAARLLGSFMYLLLQFGRLGIVLLLPSLALSVVTGIDVYLCILSMGLLSIAYTVLGGIEAVIWTDVIQVIVLIGGAILCLILLYAEVDAKLLPQLIGDYDKMRIFDLRLDWTEPTLWVVLLGGMATNIVQYGSDQTVIQRYLTTKDEKSAARSLYTGVLLTLPATLLFFSLGTLLFVFYKTQPEMLNPALPQTDGVFPWFIVSSLPNGISGLLVAAIFAASMSSLDSSMNSVATVLTTDFVQRLRPLGNEKAYLRLARGFTILVGLVATGLALIMATWGISSLWDQFNLILGLFTGGLGGIFLLGILTKRAHGTGAILGFLCSGACQFLIVSQTDLHFFLYALTGLVSAMGFGYLFSLILPHPNATQT